VSEDGKMLLRCHAGCKFEEIVAALGLRVSDLFVPDTKPVHRLGRIVCTYDYCDEKGRLLYQVVRYYPKDFRQRRPDGKGGWLYKLGDVRRALFRLAEITTAPPDQPVFLVEGEKDAERLAVESVLATTCAMGAGKWRPEYNQTLAGRQVIILPDNDPPGRDHAAQVARSLRGVAASVKIVALPGLPPKGDVSDWLAAGGTVEKLWELVEVTPTVQQDNPAPEPGAPPHPGGCDMPALSAPLGADPHHTDVGNAQRLIRRHGRDLRYCSPWGKWLHYDGGVWVDDAAQRVQGLAKETVLALFGDATRRVMEIGHQLKQLAGDDGDQIKQRRLEAELGPAKKDLTFALRSEAAPRINAMVDLARSEPGVAMSPAELDRHPMLLNVRNGTVDLTTGQLRPHNRLDLLTAQAPVEYDPSAKCPV
jgi:putative DNA primase/helicase